MPLGTLAPAQTDLCSSLGWLPIRAPLNVMVFYVDNEVSCHILSIKTEWNSMHNSRTPHCLCQGTTVVCSCK